METKKEGDISSIENKSSGSESEIESESERERGSGSERGSELESGREPVKKKQKITDSTFKSSSKNTSGVEISGEDRNPDSTCEPSYIGDTSTEEYIEKLANDMAEENRKKLLEDPKDPKDPDKGKRSKRRSKRRKSKSNNKSIRRRKSIRRKRYDGMMDVGGGSPPAEQEDERIRILDIINQKIIRREFDILNIHLMCRIIEDVMTGRKILLIVQSNYLASFNENIVELYDIIIPSEVVFVCGKGGFYISPPGNMTLPYEEHKILSFNFNEKDYLVIIDAEKDTKKPGDVSNISLEEESF